MKTYKYNQTLYKIDSYSWEDLYLYSIGLFLANLAKFRLLIECENV